MYVLQINPLLEKTRWIHLEQYFILWKTYTIWEYAGQIFLGRFQIMGFVLSNLHFRNHNALCNVSLGAVMFIWASSVY